MYFENAPDGKRQSTATSPNGYQQPGAYDDDDEYDNRPDDQFDEFVNSSRDQKQDRAIYTSDDDKNEDDFLDNSNDINILSPSYSNEQSPAANDDATAGTWLTTNNGVDDRNSSYPNDSNSHFDGRYVNNTNETNLHMNDDDDGDSDSKPIIV